MQVRNKLFPYPVINKNLGLSNYKDLTFDLSYDFIEYDDRFVFDNICFVTNSKTIQKLYDEKKIEVLLIIECSYTVFRKKFVITQQPQKLTLYKSDFNERLDCSLFAYATEDFILSSDEFDDDYLDYKFSIEKYDIVAVYDGFNMHARHEEKENNVVSSIFSIICDEKLEDGMFSVDCDSSKKIVITMAKKDFDNYKIIYAIPAYQEMFFNSLLIPALTEGFSICKSEIQDDDVDFDDICNKHIWFRSVLSSYKRLFGTDLEVDTFKKTSACSFAQQLLKKPFGSSLEKLSQQSKTTQPEEE